LDQKFKYFLYPEQFAYILKGEQECDICHKVCKCFDASTYYGEEEYNAFCFECVSKGCLEEVDATAIDPGIKSLRDQIIEKNPMMANGEIEKLVMVKTKELSFFTPMFPSWQDFLWPAHCGDYCQFIRLAGQADFNELALDGNGKEFFRNTLQEDLKNNTNIDDIWVDLKKDSVNGITDNDNWSPMAYIFRCLQCGEYITRWDCD
jgi:uncharacterized protein CbrC (UPF0167 family)